MKIFVGPWSRIRSLPFAEWQDVSHTIEDQGGQIVHEWIIARVRFRHIGRLLASLFLPTVTHPDGKQFVRINDHWMPI